MRPPKFIERLIMFGLGQLTAKLICEYLVRRQKPSLIVVKMDDAVIKSKDLQSEIDYFLRKYTNLN